MEIKINKDDLERALYVATSSSVEVFESVEPHFCDTKIEVAENILGNIGVKEVESEASVNTDEDPALLRFTKYCICFIAFLTVFRQLDLVLTPTGFGVISNDQTTPASQQRVNSLFTQLVVAKLNVYCRLVEELRNLKGWGEQECAAWTINNLLWSFADYNRMNRVEAVDTDSWGKAQNLIAECDEFLRKHISDALMDKCLQEVRTNSVTDEDRPVIFQIKRLLWVFSLNDMSSYKKFYRRLIATLETDENKYTLYWNSNAYKANHIQSFQNTQDKAGFVF